MKKTTLAPSFPLPRLPSPAPPGPVGAQPAQPAPPPPPPKRPPSSPPRWRHVRRRRRRRKEYKAKTYRANLRNSGQYGLVWDVHMVKEDETHVRAYVDAKTGKVVAADVKGIQERRPGRGMGPGPRPQCPVTAAPRARTPTVRWPAASRHLASTATITGNLCPSGLNRR